MKIGSSGARYTPGSIYQRHKAKAAYTPGSKFKRFGNLGLVQQRNLSTMNRSAIDSYRAAVAGAGPIMFEAKYAETEGLSEIAVHHVLQRAKEAANALADKSAALSIANGGTGGVDSESDDADESDGTGDNVDETV